MIKLLKLVPGGSNLFWSRGWRAEAPVCRRYQLLGNPEQSLEECLSPPQDSPSSSSEDVGATEEQFADNGLRGRKEICVFFPPLTSRTGWQTWELELYFFFPVWTETLALSINKTVFMSNWMINCVVILCFLHAMAHEKQFQFNTDLWSLFYCFQWVRWFGRKPVKTTSS